MIVTELYNGQGLGNQLWCYVVTRVIATDKGLDFGIMSPEKFKGHEFMDLDFGKKVEGGEGPEGGPANVLPKSIKHYYKEKKLNHPVSKSDISIYDPNLVAIPDHTKVDGNMQDEQYIVHRRAEIREWLKVRPEHECYDYSDDNICVINFRGGEYRHIPDVFLTQDYWDKAVANMRKINKDFRFVVITDDVRTAKKFFPKFEVFHFSIAKDYVIVKNAKYLILANSSFAWFPAWLNTEVKYCIAPKYWWSHNRSDGYWACGYNITSGWMYQDREGNLDDYDTCLKELRAFEKANPELYQPTKIERNTLVVSNHNNDVSWVAERTQNYVIYDRSDKGQIPYTVDRKKVIIAPNIGYNLYDYFTYIIDNYDTLPEVVIFTKGNTFPRHVTPQFFDRISNNRHFTAIEDFRMHSPRWPVSFFASDGGFCEINNSWYLREHPTKYFHHYNHFLEYCFKDVVIPKYNRFAPGGNYIVPRANIQKIPKIVYENFRHIISHCPLAGETHILERALHMLWTSSFEFSEAILKPFPKDFVARPYARTKLGKITLLARKVVGK